MNLLRCSNRLPLRRGGGGEAELFCFVKRTILKLYLNLLVAQTHASLWGWGLSYCVVENSIAVISKGIMSHALYNTGI